MIFNLQGRVGLGHGPSALAAGLRDATVTGAEDSMPRASPRCSNSSLSFRAPSTSSSTRSSHMATCTACDSGKRSHGEVQQDFPLAAVDFTLVQCVCGAVASPSAPRAAAYACPISSARGRHNPVAFECLMSTEAERRSTAFQVNGAIGSIRDGLDSNP